MRLWHYKLIPYLPKSQLVAQWRELNSIYKKQDKHILINYIYDYGKEYLFSYSAAVILEMDARGYNVKSLENFNNYFSELLANRQALSVSLYYREHNFSYLRQCFYNLQEKFDRGQKDFSAPVYAKLRDFVASEHAL